MARPREETDRRDSTPTTLPDESGDVTREHRRGVRDAGPHIVAGLTGLVPALKPLSQFADAIPRVGLRDGPQE
jgi:hypothetical protein